MEKRVNFVFSSLILIFNVLKKSYHSLPLQVENMARKEDSAGNQKFLRFNDVFFPIKKKCNTFTTLKVCRLKMLSTWTSLQYHRLVQRLVARKLKKNRRLEAMNAVQQ